jgi:hypothetical protein
MTPREQLRAALSEIEKGADNARDVAGDGFELLQDHGKTLDLDPDGGFQAMRHLGEAVRLIHALHFFVKEAPISEIHRLFRAPGDWGYETPLGAALYRLYSEEEAKP